MTPRGNEWLVVCLTLLAITAFTWKSFETRPMVLRATLNGSWPEFGPDGTPAVVTIDYVPVARTGLSGGRVVLTAVPPFEIELLGDAAKGTARAPSDYVHLRILRAKQNSTGMATGSAFGASFTFDASQKRVPLPLALGGNMLLLCVMGGLIALVRLKRRRSAAPAAS